jgi:hypothetical protein
MSITEVTTEKTEAEFLDVARKIYKNDKTWVCPLDKDIDGIFNPNENPFYKHGMAKRWVLKNDSGELIGRIAAFIDYKKANDSDQPTGGVGFFECVDSQEAANLLFETAKTWLLELNMQAMDGPINFGEPDKFWGCLVEGFTQPAYNVAYNLPYYQSLFENYGFKVYYNQEGFHYDLAKGIPPRFWKIAEWITKKPGYSFEHFQFKNIDKHATDFTKVFNEAWKDFKEDFEPMDTDYVRVFVKKARLVLEEKFIWIAYFEGEPVAIFLMMPDVNQVFKSFDGKLNLFNKLKLLYLVKTRKIRRAKAILMGVIPRFQGLGIESAFIYKIDSVLKAMPEYTEVEFSWVGDFNPPMRKLWESVGAEPAKKYITYRYLFDRDAPFKRYPIPE